MKKQYLYNWANRNRQLLEKYKNKWIAFNETGIIVASADIDELFRIANSLTNDYVIYSNHRFGKVRF